MHGSEGKKSFSERFRCKNAPEKTRKAGGGDRRAKAKRYIGAPWEFIVDVRRLTRGATTLTVALYIYRRTVVTDNLTVTLPSAELSELGVTRQCKQMALTHLETVRLIKVENVRGRTARITLLWQQP